MGTECLDKLRKLGHVINPKDKSGHVPQGRTVLVIDHKTALLHAADDRKADSSRTTGAFCHLFVYVGLVGPLDPTFSDNVSAMFPWARYRFPLVC